MLYLLSQNDEWQFYVTEIADHFKDTRKQIIKGMQELEEAGLIIKTKERGKKGKFIYTYDIFETPKTREEYDAGMGN